MPRDPLNAEDKLQDAEERLAQIEQLAGESAALLDRADRDTLNVLARMQRDARLLRLRVSRTFAAVA